MSDCGRFLLALFDGCDGTLELRALPSRARTFLRLGDLDAVHAFMRARAHENIYVGVATRRDARGGDLAHCLHLPALFVDVDYAKTPVDQARAAVRRFPLRPSGVVRSGGGAHLYYLLREPMDLREEAEPARAKDLLRRLARHVGGDLSAAEPARVLRLPDTHNHKYTPPRPVTLAHLDAAARFNPIDFDTLLPAELVPTGARRFVSPAVIVAGARNTTLYTLGRSLKARGLAEREIAATLTAVNTDRCRPPLGEAEVRAIAHHAATQADRPAFGGREPRLFSVRVL